MVFTITFSEEKNQVLQATRGVGFEEVIKALASQQLLADLVHPDPKRVHQRIFVVQLNNYAYAVPYVVNQPKGEIFLKTVYPSRSLTKRYIKKG